MSMKIKKFEFEIKKLKKIVGHDDTLPYVGELWCNGKCLCKCMNDGWGGDTNITPISSDFDKIDKIIKATNGLYGHTDWHYSLAVIADILAEKEIFNKNIKRYFAKNLVFVKDDPLQYMRVPIKQGRRQVPIKELVANESYKAYMMKVIEKYTSQGFKLANDNI